MEDESLPYILAVDDDFAVRMAMDFMFKKWPEYNLYWRKIQMMLC